jgi:predicted  nucleic acid-binding Zn-ribbon protein
MADEQTMKDHIADLMIEIANLYERIRQLESEREQLQRQVAQHG